MGSGSSDALEDIEDIADHVALHDAVTVVPPSIAKRIGERLKKANNPEKKLKVYKEIIAHSIKGGTIENWKFLHALHVARKHYLANVPHQCTTDLDAMYDKFLTSSSPTVVTFNDGDLDAAFTASKTNHWTTNGDPNAGAWKAAAQNIFRLTNSQVWQYAKTKEGKKWMSANIGYENSLFDDNNDYELNDDANPYDMINGYKNSYKYGDGYKSELPYSYHQQLSGGNYNAIQNGNYGDAYMYGLMAVAVVVFLCIMTVLCCVFGAFFGYVSSVAMRTIYGDDVENDGRKHYAPIDVADE